MFNSLFVYNVVQGLNMYFYLLLFTRKRICENNNNPTQVMHS